MFKMEMIKVMNSRIWKNKYVFQGINPVGKMLLIHKLNFFVNMGVNLKNEYRPIIEK